MTLGQAGAAGRDRGCRGARHPGTRTGGDRRARAASH